MNDNLQNALLAIINSTTNAVGKGVDFLSDQIPDVIHQLLLWKAVESGIYCAVWTVICLVLLSVSAYLLRKGYNYIPANKYDEGGSIYYIIGSILFFVSLIASWGIFCHMDWLQILIAPKLYLIEYAAHLVKVSTP